MPLIVESVRARAKGFTCVRPRGWVAVPRYSAGDALGTQNWPIYADRRRPHASDTTNISVDSTGATTYRRTSLKIA